VGDRQPITEVMVGTWTLLIDRKGSLWVGSAGDGLRRVRDPDVIRGRKVTQFGPEAEQFTQKNGLLSDIVQALLEDREGNIWVATGRGLERFREGVFTPVETPDPGRPRFVFADRDSALWSAAFNSRGILRLAPHDRELLPTAFSVQSVAQDPAGVLWAVSGGRDLFRLEGRRFIPVPAGRSRVRKLNSITVDPTGTVWVYDEELGLLRWSGDSLGRAPPLPEGTARHSLLFGDREGRVWLGQQDRTAVLDHGRWRLFDAAAGLEPGEVNAFLEDRAGNLWVASDAGLSRFDGGRFRSLRGHQSLPGRSVYGLAEDDTGAWWVVIRTGVVRLPPGELDRALADSAYRVRFQSFDRLDGLPGLVGGGSWGPQVTRASDGRIWVATDSGVARVDPGDLQPRPPPPVLIETVRLGGRQFPPSEVGTIPPGSRDLEIDFTATSLSTPERTQFRYRLEGEDRTWREVGLRRQAYYSGLGPGAYRFRVSASHGDGVWTAPEAVWNFRVLPAWYQTLWFQSGVVLLIGGVGAAAAVLVQRRRHLRSQRALKAHYEVTLAERARIAQDLHDTLLQGFAGVTLQLKAAEQALPEDAGAAAEALQRVQRLAQISLREARERVWDLHGPDLDGDLPAVLEGSARERIGGSGIELTVVTTGRLRRLSPLVEDTAFRIGREAVANAVGHAQARHIDIRVEFGATALRLEVRDDGRGFTPEEAEAARRRGHFGLSGARERAARMGGRCDVLARPEGGTIVTLELPLAEPSGS
jgi:signal transduction histidine kinase/ligand-binding sensor domain-containing protein